MDNGLKGTHSLGMAHFWSLSTRRLTVLINDPGYIWNLLWLPRTDAVAVRSRLGLNRPTRHEYLSTADDDQQIPRIRINEGQYDANRPFRHEVHSQASDLDSPIYAAGEQDDIVHLTSQNTVWRRSAPYERDIERRRVSRGARRETHPGTQALI
ncbi:hypothetical protein PIIN_03952 [Serendipita indica DSM 11827]|uniref:Uncharacterized protein n=1 Tax=Serendipita indica (strain DSM 11827) TaxID=1109443 RepID=G4TFB1_SERID|nr:hypothetical protein PIIN_03952 [Serendipita indica DSM 11827]